MDGDSFFISLGRVYNNVYNNVYVCLCGNAVWRRILNLLSDGGCAHATIASHKTHTPLVAWQGNYRQTHPI